MRILFENLINFAYISKNFSENFKKSHKNHNEILGKIWQIVPQSLQKKKCIGNSGIG